MKLETWKKSDPATMFPMALRQELQSYCPEALDGFEALKEEFMKVIGN